MPNLPKIVSERLKAVAPVGNHPDADLLTAFAEQSLPKRERSAVLEHLAGCGDCREIVALSLPETEVPASSTIAPRRGWLTWPVLRWGFVAAGIVVIASLGVLQYQRPQRAQMSAKTTLSPVDVAREAPASAQAPEPAAPAAKQGKADASLSYFADRLNAPVKEPKPMLRGTPIQPSVGAAATAGGAAAGAVLGGPLAGPVSQNLKVSPQWQQSARPEALAPAPPPAPAKPQYDTLAKALPPASTNETVEVQSEAVQLDTQAQKTEELPKQSAQPQTADYHAANQLAKAKDLPVPQTANSTSTTIPTPAINQLPVNGRSVADSARIASTLRWTISPTGALQCSFDQGKTWQGVDVNASSVARSSEDEFQVVGGAMAKESDADKKTAKRQFSTPIFRAVTALGPEVWAGGSAGVLYHSQDAGFHWTRVVPSANGAILTGDIVGVEFSDSQHGKITTSVPEIWTTTNTGQTWQKQ